MNLNKPPLIEVYIIAEYLLSKRSWGLNGSEVGSTKGVVSSSSPLSKDKVSEKKVAHSSNHFRIKYSRRTGCCGSLVSTAEPLVKLG